jgi:hypothetical protein
MILICNINIIFNRNLNQTLIIKIQQLTNTLHIYGNTGRTRTEQNRAEQKKKY